jgi:F-type H+-transporting ATPase subunit b
MGAFIQQYLPDFFWSLTAFVVFVLIILKFGIKPVFTALDAREKKIADEVAEAERTFTRAKQLQAELDAQLKNAESRMTEMYRKAEREAEERKAVVLEQGRVAAEELRTRALRDIEAARHQAIVALRDEVAAIATEVAGRIVRSELNAQMHQELVGRAIDLYEAQHGSGGQG